MADDKQDEKDTESVFPETPKVALDPDEERPEDPDARDFKVEGNDTDGYVGISPEYATYANETEAPMGEPVPDSELEDDDSDDDDEPEDDKSPEQPEGVKSQSGGKPSAPAAGSTSPASGSSGGGSTPPA